MVYNCYDSFFFEIIIYIINNISFCKHIYYKAKVIENISLQMIMRKKRNACENFLRNMTYTIFKSHNNNNNLLVCLLFIYKERIKKAI